MSQDYIQKAINLAKEFKTQKTGGPFGAVIVKDNKIIAEGRNLVTVNQDPTAHAEIVAIRNACKSLNSFQLEGCSIYSSCEPCPMCLSAIYWARFDQIFFAVNREDAAKIGFDDQFIYDEIPKALEQRKIPCSHIKANNALEPFKEWNEFSEKIKY